MTVKTFAELRGADYIDSRDLIETWRDLVGGDELNPDPDIVAELDEDEAELVSAISKLADEDVSDWEYGAQLIREDCFVDYAKELAEDIGAISEDSWPQRYIDWDAAAAALREDYETVEFLGSLYLVRL